MKQAKIKNAALAFFKFNSARPLQEKVSVSATGTFSWSVFTTSLEPTLSKIRDERKPHYCLASLGNTKKKKHSLHFCFGGGKISFEKRKGHFSLGFCPPSILAVWRGFNADSVL